VQTGHLCIFSYVNANLHCLFTLPPLGSALQTFDLHKRLGPSILAILLLTLPQLLLVYLVQYYLAKWGRSLSSKVI
jgi:hypothetical protein